MELDLISKLCIVGLIIYGTSLHEMGHAYVANWLGDPTPGRHGRLTWNPIPHLSPPLFAIVAPIVGYLATGCPFGLALTPIDPSRFKNPVRDHALVAVAGPFMDFLLTGILIGVAWIPGVWRYPFNYTTVIIFWAGLWNAILGVFNLIPIPPLDGYWIVRGLLPFELRRAADGFARSEFSFLLVLIAAPALFGYFELPVVNFYKSLLPSL